MSLEAELRKIDTIQSRIHSEDLITKLNAGDPVNIFTLFELDCLISEVLFAAISYPGTYVQIETAMGTSNYQTLMSGLLLQYFGIKKQIETYAKRDPLTKLYNRTAFDALLAANVAQFLQGSIPDLSEVIFDIDFFKSVNDKLGHAKGDEVLKTTCSIIQSNFRNPERANLEAYQRLLRGYLLNPGEMGGDQLQECIQNLLTTQVDFGTMLKYEQLGRFGGEEIVAVFPGVNLAGAYRIANHIRADIRKRFRTVQVGDRKGITISGGLQTAASIIKNRDLFFATMPSEAQLVSELFHQIDAALYVAKASGRNKILSFRNALQRLDCVEDTKKISGILGIDDLQEFRVKYK